MKLNLDENKIMRRKIISLLIASFIIAFCQAQLPHADSLFNYKKNAVLASVGNDSIPFIVVVIPKKLSYNPIYALYNGEAGKGTFVRFFKDTLVDALYNDSIFRSKRLQYAIAQTFDSSKALVFVQGVNKANAYQYEYRILVNNKLNENWKPFTDFYPYTYKSGFGENDPEMAFIGYLGTTWNNYLTVDVRKKNSDKITASSTILWSSYQPKIIATYGPGELNNFFTLFQLRTGMQRALQADSEEEKFLKTRKEFSSAENSIIFYLDDLVRQRIIEYKVEGPAGGNDWKLNNFDFDFIWLNDLKPGKYKLLIRYSTQRHNISEYDFEIKPSWHQTTWFKITAGSLIAAFFGFIIVLFRSKAQKQKLEKVQLQKEKTEIELKAIRSQLNPHFVYNCLNSIQSLINRNNIYDANRYLTEFSKLMRETLNASDRKFTSLATELKLLETYLMLEQLRFGFEYQIIVSPEIDAETTELPSLLLQPLVENAVKHGAGPLEKKGLVRVDLMREKKDLVILIFDNGKNFENKSGNGYGLKFTEDRINLLNKAIPDQPIWLNLQTSEYGTTVHLSLKNTLA
jgi:two-component system, LytTR family, sensor kinase